MKDKKEEKKESLVDSPPDLQYISTRLIGAQEVHSRPVVMIQWGMSVPLTSALQSYIPICYNIAILFAN
jgi:hypothetical protein